MKYTDFKTKTENGEEYSAYLFVGEDAFFRERGLSLLKERFVSEPSLNFAVLEGEKPDIGEIVSSINAFPFMSKKRITVLREFYPKAEMLKGDLKTFLEGDQKDSILVVLNGNPCEQLKKFNGVCVVDCTKQDSSLIMRWIKAECVKNGVNIDSETALKLAEYCLCDMTRVNCETQKLIDYVGRGGVISLTEIDALVNKDAEYKVWQMTEYIAKKQFDLAYEVVADMLNKGEAFQKILTSIYNYFRKLLHVAISDMTESQLATAFSIQPFAVSKLKVQASKFSKRALKRAVDALEDYDYKIKAGLIDDEKAMWLALFKILTDK